jgi:hypothetical protein
VIPETIIGVCAGVSGWAERPSLAGPMTSAREQPYSVLLRWAACREEVTR